MLRNKLITAAGVIIATASTASTVMAQGTPSPAPEQSTLISYALAVVAAMAVIGLSVMSAKRTHND